MLTYHTAIIGAGASGLFCAGSFSRPKILLDHNRLPGVKVGVSGGGKCNFSNRFVSAADYQSASAHFCKNALSAFTPAQFTHLLDEQGIPYEERAGGQLFARRAQDIVRFLVRRAEAAHTDFSLGTHVLKITREQDTFFVYTSNGTLAARHVVLACGGLSYPALGADSFGIKTARQWGLTITPQRPALCGLRVPKDLRPLCRTLAGNSTPVTVHIGKHVFTGPLLFTHEGISGPAVLSASLFWQEGQALEIHFLPGQDVLAFLRARKQLPKKIAAVLPLPGKMAATLLGDLNVYLPDATKDALRAAASRIQHFQVIPTGTAGYTQAEVTAGGIAPQEINPATFEVRRVPGLYAIGELVDVTGRLGGFNLHWAWSSGYCAACHLARAD